MDQQGQERAHPCIHETRCHLIEDAVDALRPDQVVKVSMQLVGDVAQLGV